VILLSWELLSGGFGRLRGAQPRGYDPVRSLGAPRREGKPLKGGVEKTLSA